MAKKRRALALALVGLIAALSYLLFPEAPGGVLAGPYPVDRVVDGDTIVVEIEGAMEKVRLIGLDTPESVHEDAQRNVPYGKIAAAYTAGRLEGRMVHLEYDVDFRDDYGRVLAYVWLGDEMINRTLLSEGHAVLATFPPNIRYVDEFTRLQNEARQARKGLWAKD